MNDRKPVPFDIAAVGLGISGIHQVTREAEETIRRCTQTFVTDMAIGVVDHLKTLSTRVTDLSRGYELGDHRIEIYRRMATEVVTAAMEDPPVCFATYGHPKMFCYPTTLIQRAARVLDLEVTVLPGVSSLDTLLADLGVDPGFDGLQLYEATDLVIRRRPLQSDVPAVIVQAPIVLDAYNRPGGPDIKNLELLERYLLDFYPPGHTVLNVLSKTHPLLEPLIQQIPLRRLAEALAKGSNVGTLFIPPVGHRDVADEELAERMRLETDGHGHKQAPKRRPGRPEIGPQAS
jgi:uncharacterized protein YabN with tetrapyrrole methylase and pyrophosphatase domain